MLPFRGKPLFRFLALWLSGATVIVAVAVFFWPRERDSLANFQKIRIGMSQAELLGLLGPPNSATAELGLVVGPDKYGRGFRGPEIEAKKRKHGFRDYLRQEWGSADRQHVPPKSVSIVVISDLEGKVVCR
jgi:hypothetical protein